MKTCLWCQKPILSKNQYYCSLKCNKLYVEPRPNITKEEMEEVYINQRLGVRKAAKKLNMGRPTFLKYLKKFNIPKHKIGIYRKYVPNDYFFNKWGSEMAYCLGFIAADGHVWEKRHFITIGIHKKDVAILEKIRNCISPKSKVRFTGDKCQLCIKSEQIHKDLNRLGINHKKTFNLRFPKVPKKYLGDFVRGFFDGDGGIWKAKRKIVDYYTSSITCASEKFIYDLQNVLGFGTISRTGKNRKYYRIDFSQSNSLKLKKLMYKNNTDLKLNRKYVLFEKIRSNNV